MHVCADVSSEVQLVRKDPPGKETFLSQVLGSHTGLKEKEANVLCIHIVFIFCFLKWPFLSTTVDCILY